MVLLPTATAAQAAERAVAAPVAYACDIDYLTDPGGTQFGVRIGIDNPSNDYTINGWTLRFTLPAGQTALPASAYNVRITQVGQEVTGTDVGWNAQLLPLNTLWVGFQVVGPDYRVKPTAFWVNGNVCSVGLWTRA